MWVMSNFCMYEESFFGGDQGFAIQADLLSLVLLGVQELAEEYSLIRSDHKE